MSHVQSPIDRPARCTKTELAGQVESLKCRVAELEAAATDRIQVEDALRMSEARLRAIMDHAPTEIFLVDREGRYVLVNKEFERRYGLTEKQVAGKTMADFFPADVTAAFTAQDRETLESGRTMVREQVLEYGGVVHTDLEIKFPIIDLAGTTVGVGGIATDITDRKKAEAALQQAHDELEERVAERTAELAAAQRLAKIGNWRWAVGRDALISCSEEYARIHGVGTDEIDDLMKTQMARVIHPDDCDRVEAEFKRFDDEGIDYEIEYRILRTDGEVRHVLELGKAIRDAAGNAVEQVGTVQDITELKLVAEDLRQARDELELRVEERTSELHQTYEALRESEHRYREIFEESPVGIWEEDWSEAKRFIDKLAKRGVKDFRRYFARRPERAQEFYDLITITDASRAILDLYGVSDLVELRRLFPAMAEPNDNMQGTLDSLYGFLEGTMEREYEVREFRADGRDITTHMRAVVPPQRMHDWSRVIYAIEDITERKRADEALRDSEAHLAEAQRIAMIGHWVWDEKADLEIYASEISSDIFGTPPGWVAGSFDEWLTLVHPDDRERIGSLMYAALECREGYDVEYWIVRPDGETRFIHERAQMELDDDGEVVRTTGTVQDITGRKHAEHALRESEQRYRELFDQAPVAIRTENFSKVKARIDALEIDDTNVFAGYLEQHPNFVAECAKAIEVLDVNQAALRLHNADAEAVLKANVTQNLSTAALATLKDVLLAVHRGETSLEFETFVTRSDGSRREIEALWSVAPGYEQDYSHVLVISVDITERKRAENALRESEARFRTLLDNAPLEIYLKDTEGHHIMVGRQSEELYGSADRPVLGRTAHEMFATAQADVHLEHDREVFESGQALEREYEVPFDDGVHSFMSVKFPVPDAAGDIKSIGAVTIDITERKRVEEALGESEQRYRELFEQAPLSMWLDDWTSVKETVDRLRRRGVKDWRRYFRRRPDQVTKIFDSIETIEISRATLELFRAPTKQAVIEVTASGRVTPEELAGFTENLLAFIGGETRFVYEAREVAYDGTEIFTRNKVVILPDHRDNWSRVIFSVDDITELRHAEEALRESESRLAQAQRIANVGHWAWDEKTGEQLYSSGEAARMFGVADGYVCASLEEYLSMIHPDDRERVAEEFGRANREQRGYEIEFRVEHPERGTRVVIERAEAKVDDNGEVVQTVGTVQDITERRLVEDKMREFQADLAHVSRVNMLGEMTAGLAHELNQPLAVISSYAQGCLSSFEAGKGAPETLAGALQQIVSQSTRASEIVRRIRGFIRKDRRPKSRIDVNAAIGVAIEMLKGETGANGVAIRMDLAEPSPTAIVDDIELQQVILNLARNSIEMMVSQGHEARELHIRTAARMLPRGDGVGRVEVSVQDTGPGVPPEIRDHIFEPFFTTKPQGLGLGLSICRSILDRHDGNLWLGGDGGTGADFRFTLPLGTREGQ